MDEEAREALDLSKSDLLRMAAEGEPARVAHKKPVRVRAKQAPNQSAAAIVAGTTEAPMAPDGSVEIRWVEGAVVLEALTARHSPH